LGAFDPAGGPLSAAPAAAVGVLAGTRGVAVFWIRNQVDAAEQLDELSGGRVDGRRTPDPGREPPSATAARTRAKSWSSSVGGELLGSSPVSPSARSDGGAT